MPRLVFAIMPGGIASDARSRGIVLHDLSRIAPETLVITVIGDRDAPARPILPPAASCESRAAFRRTASCSYAPFPTITASPP